MKIEAGYQLYTRNPMQVAATTTPRPPTSIWPSISAAVASAIAIVVPIAPAAPSVLSSRLNAFVITTRNTTLITMSIQLPNRSALAPAATARPTAGTSIAIRVVAESPRTSSTRPAIETRHAAARKATAPRGQPGRASALATAATQIATPPR